MNIPNRRDALRKIGFVALALAGAASADAQTASADAQTRVTEAELKLKLSNPEAVKVLRLSNRLPGTTPVSKMGLTREAQAGLTDAAKKLTKDDLVALGGGKITENAKELTVADIQSVSKAFAVGYKKVNAVDISCCCCTPCCCAAA